MALMVQARTSSTRKQNGILSVVSIRTLDYRGGSSGVRQRKGRDVSHPARAIDTGTGPDGLSPETLLRFDHDLSPREFGAKYGNVLEEFAKEFGYEPPDVREVWYWHCRNEHRPGTLAHNHDILWTECFEYVQAKLRRSPDTKRTSGSMSVRVRSVHSDRRRHAAGRVNQPEDPHAIEQRAGEPGATKRGPRLPTWSLDEPLGAGAVGDTASALIDVIPDTGSTSDLDDDYAAADMWIEVREVVARDARRVVRHACGHPLADGATNDGAENANADSTAPSWSPTTEATRVPFVVARAGLLNFSGDVGNMNSFDPIPCFTVLDPRFTPDALEQSLPGPPTHWERAALGSVVKSVAGIEATSEPGRWLGQRIDEYLEKLRSRTDKQDESAEPWPGHLPSLARLLIDPEWHTQLWAVEQVRHDGRVTHREAGNTSANRAERGLGA